MLLTKLRIENYRSVKELEIGIIPLEDGSYSFGLLGINEVGKSSILKALAFYSEIAQFKPTIKDFNDTAQNIKIVYYFRLRADDIQELKAFLKPKVQVMDVEDLIFDKLKCTIEINPKSLKHQKVYNLEIQNVSLENLDILNKLISTFENFKFKTIYWKAESQYLISQPINIQQFAADPTKSIPLQNCFSLAGYSDLSTLTTDLSESTERERIRDLLGSAVTKHIKSVWKDHKIKITFDISDGLINFHIKDSNSKERAKTSDQRSDGFRQFISFLLTLSAQYQNKELQNTLILLDEPETHLHPTAQLNLLREIIEISKGQSNNVLFFATHSNYLVDKECLERNYKVIKDKDRTKIHRFEQHYSSYASVNYEVFEIPTSDYHNELYGKLYSLSEIENLTKFDEYIQEKVEGSTVKKGYKHTNGKEFDCSLSTYIRHQIHHPENDKNKRYTYDELSTSIKIMLEHINLLLQNKA